MSEILSFLDILLSHPDKLPFLIVIVVCIVTFWNYGEKAIKYVQNKRNRWWFVYFLDKMAKNGYHFSESEIGLRKAFHSLYPKGGTLWKVSRHLYPKGETLRKASRRLHPKGGTLRIEEGEPRAPLSFCKGSS